MAEKSVQKTKLKNLEELRCLAMMMVVVLHFLGKGNLLGDVNAASMGSVGTVAWILEAFCIVAVNCYMLISGYFLCESSFRLSRLWKLYLQIWMYSVGIGVLAAWTGILAPDQVSVHYYLTLLLPISMGHYWFMTAYVFLYLLLPLVTMAVKQMNSKQLNLALIMLLGLFCVLKSVLPFRLEEERMGYDMIWYLCVLLVAAKIRKSNVSFLNKRWKCMTLYLGGIGLMLAEMFALRFVFLKTGSFELITKVSFEYNHIFVLMASVGLFGFFVLGKGEGIIAELAAKISPYVLGTYLLHENFGVRYGWQKWFHAENIENVPELILWTIIASLCVFITGVITECIRSYIVKILGKLAIKGKIGKLIWNKILQVDSIFVSKMN